MIKDIVSCFFATFFFSLIMNAPKKSIGWSALIASAGYTIYVVISKNYNDLLGYFVGTLVITLSGEILARRIKMPATIFIFPSVIPLVPGLGLYKMMLAFVQEDIFTALEIGTKTVFIAGVMAISMAIINLAVLRIPMHSDGKKHIG